MLLLLFSFCLSLCDFGGNHPSAGGYFVQSIIQLSWGNICHAKTVRYILWKKKPKKTEKQMYGDFKLSQINDYYCVLWLCRHHTHTHTRMVKQHNMRSSRVPCHPLGNLIFDAPPPTSGYCGKKKTSLSSQTLRRLRPPFVRDVVVLVLFFRGWVMFSTWRPFHSVWAPPYQWGAETLGKDRQPCWKKKRLWRGDDISLEKNKNGMLRTQ